jgi:hypothetical protein
MICSLKWTKMNKKDGQPPVASFPFNSVLYNKIYLSDTLSTDFFAAGRTGAVGP